MKRSSSSSSSEESSCDSNISSDEKEVPLSFEGFNMSPTDYHAIKNFLANIFGRGISALKGGDLGTVDTSGLAKLLVDVLSEYVGTTAKDEEKEDPMAFVSLIPMHLPTEVFSPEERMQEDQHGQVITNLFGLLKKALKKSMTNKAAIQQMDLKLQNAKEVALVIHERFINLPSEVAAPLYKQLLDDLPAAGEESPCFDPKFVMLLVPIYREIDSQIDQSFESDDEAGEGTSEKGEQKEKRVKKKKVKTEVDTEFQYYYAEDELLPLISESFWDFRIKTPHDTSDSRRAFGDRGVDPARRVFLLTIEEFKTFVDQCQSLA